MLSGVQTTPHAGCTGLRTQAPGAIGEEACIALNGAAPPNLVKPRRAGGVDAGAVRRWARPAMTTPERHVTEAEAWIAALIAHDLASPIGAVSAAIETLEDGDLDTDFRAEAMALAQESARRATDLLRFLRAAYGPAPASASAIAALAEATVAAMAYKKITVDWPATALDDGAEARFAALFAHAASALAPRGGRLRVRDQGGPHLALVAEDPIRQDAIAPADGPKSSPWRLMQRIAESSQSEILFDASNPVRFVIKLMRFTG